uniref:Uncharacterized protein n=1 Tax=Pristionchus pacificus TaxID=54126 RepID=A0A8R1V562_PRIPA
MIHDLGLFLLLKLVLSSPNLYRDPHDPGKDLAFLPLTKPFIDQISDESRYNRYATPTQYDGIPTNVSISMYIEGITSFQARTMDFHIDMYFQQDWIDARLAHNGSAPILVRDKAIFKQMWHPDVYFANARSASFQHVTDDNFLVWIYPNGRVWYDCRISATIMCDMNLWKFPLDQQECDMRILSYAYPEKQLRLRWTNRTDLKAIEANPEIKMPDMELVFIKQGHCNGTYATGVWSCMTAVFRVERQMMHHVMQTYLPTCLIVVISWFNFWLDVDSAPARVTLSITTLLTISTQANGVELALPEVSYMKAIDVWMGACMAFVFGVMIEFTICHYAKNLEMARGERCKALVNTAIGFFGASFGKQTSIDELNDEDLGMPGGGTITLKSLREEDETEPRLRGLNGDFERNGSLLHDTHPLRQKRQSVSFTKFRKQTASTARRAIRFLRDVRKLRGRRLAQRIDEKCRVAFPMAFLIFNICYWSFYLFFHPNLGDETNPRYL